MANAEIVIFRFATFGETGQAAVLAHGVHTVAAAGEHFVRIALVAYVPNQVIIRRVIHIMQCHSQLHRT